MGGPGAIAYMYLGEFHAENHRAKSICFLGFFFTLAWLILPGNNFIITIYKKKKKIDRLCFATLILRNLLTYSGVAWIIIPLPISFEFYGIHYNSWRLFLGVFSVPLFIIGVILLQYPESPKFLLSQGKTDEALAVLRNIYAVNTGRDKSEFPVRNAKICSLILDLKTHINLFIDL